MDKAEKNLLVNKNKYNYSNIFTLEFDFHYLMRKGLKYINIFIGQNIKVKVSKYTFI